MAPSWHATLNAFLNALSAGLLLAAFIIWLTNRLCEKYPGRSAG